MVQINKCIALIKSSISFFQVITLYAEYLPTVARGKAILVMSFFWAIGATFEAVLALITMGPNYGWRYVMLIL